MGLSYRHHNYHYDITSASISEITIQIKRGTLPVFFSLFIFNAMTVVSLDSLGKNALSSLVASPCV